MGSLIKDYCFSVLFNCSDTFNYACAEAVQVDVNDLWWIQEIENEYGVDGVNACLAIITEREVIKPLQTEMYFKAKEAIKQLNPEIQTVY